MTLREKVVLVPLVVMIFWIGIYPKTFFHYLEPSVKVLIRQVEEGRKRYDYAARNLSESKDTITEANLIGSHEEESDDQR